MVISQKDGSQNGVNKKTKKHAKVYKKPRNFLTPWYVHVRYTVHEWKESKFGICLVSWLKNIDQRKLRIRAIFMQWCWWLHNLQSCYCTIVTSTATQKSTRDLQSTNWQLHWRSKFNIKQLMMAFLRKSNFYFQSFFFIIFRSLTIFLLTTNS